MSRCIALRLALPIVLAAALLPAATLAQSQDTQSVAEAARRAREQKKAQTKPGKVITDDDVKTAVPASSAAPTSAAPPESTPPSGTPAPAVTNAASAPAAAAPADSSAAQSPKKASEDEKVAKEIAELKEQIKQAESDLDLAQREFVLERDNHYSKPDYIHDTAGKAKLDAVKQQAIDKQQELDRLKARLAELQASQGSSTATPPKP